MIFRKINVVLLILLILLSGCSSNTPIINEESKNEEEVAGENLGQQNEKTGDIVTDGVLTDSDDLIDMEEGPIGSSMDGDIHENSKEEKEGNTSENNIAGVGENISKNGEVEIVENKNENDNIVELIPMAQLPDLTLEPQSFVTPDEIEALRSVLLPVYHDTFRYQIREFREAYLSMDIGNTGNETLVVTDENLYFSIFDLEGNECAGSKVQGAPIHIAPGEIKRVVVTAEDPDASFVMLNLGGKEYSLTTPLFRALPNEQQDIVDTTPYNKSTMDGVVDGVPYVVATKAMEVIGNGKAKVVGNGLMVVENKKIGKIECSDDGFIALVRVKIANTSNEIMNIEKLTLTHADDMREVNSNDLIALGDKALPFTIKPNTIVEGWVPLSFDKNQYFYGINIHSNYGIFVLGDIQGYSIF